MKLNKQDLLDAAIELAVVNGYRNVSRDQIAAAAGVGQGTITNHLGNIKQIRRAIVRHAVRVGNQTIIAQAAVNSDPYVVRRVSKDDRIEAMRSVL